MEQKVKFYYEDGMDLLNVLEGLALVLPRFGVKLEILEGGKGYEEISLSSFVPYSGLPQP
jgi:hypothetical protein